MRKVTALLFAVSLVLASCLVSSASPANYPPYSFKSGPYKQFPMKLVYCYVMKKDVVNHGDLTVEVSDTDYLTKEIKLRSGSKMIYRAYDCSPATEIYVGDLDGNRLEDAVFIHPSIANGLGLQGAEIVILLKMSHTPLKYMEISMRNGASDSHLAPVYTDISDFTDINNDGKCELIVCSFYYGAEDGIQYNYFSYSIFRFNDFRLVNSNEAFKGFPKFVWFSFEPNDKDTSKLPESIRNKHVDEVNGAISYKELMP